MQDGGLLALKTGGQEEHARYGGVVPEIASRAHQAWLAGLVQGVMTEHQIPWTSIDAVAYTRGPGLLGSLMVGASLAKGLALALNKPLLGVNHLHAHLVSPGIENRQAMVFPALILTVSGGHTHLVRMDSWLDWEVLAETRDDAAGEAFDKCAKMLGLGYPGGPALDRLAQSGNPQAHRWPKTQLGLDSYSFSGIKTSLLYYLQKNKPTLINEAGSALADLCASLQSTLVEMLLGPMKAHVQVQRPASLALAGGVACNSQLRRECLALGEALGLPVFIPAPAYCTDNAAMVAFAATHLWEAGATSRDALTERPLARWPLHLYAEELLALNPGSWGKS
jgi:N6-L-threonylcarbamoyladenine synthase